MENCQEMNHPPKINSSPEKHGLLENKSKSEDIAESLTSLLSSFSPSFTPSPHHENAESRGRVRELEEALLPVATHSAGSRAKRAENLLAVKPVDKAGKNAENSELTRANDDLKRKLEGKKKVDAKRPINRVPKSTGKKQEKKSKKSTQRGSSKKQASSARVTSVKGVDPSMSELTMEERYGDATEVVCEGCVWTKVDGEWTVVVGKKDVEPTFDVTFADDEVDKMIEEMIRAKKERIDAGIEKF